MDLIQTARLDAQAILNEGFSVPAVVIDDGDLEYSIKIFAPDISKGISETGQTVYGRQIEGSASAIEVNATIGKELQEGWKAKYVDHLGQEWLYKFRRVATDRGLGVVNFNLEIIENAP